MIIGIDGNEANVEKRVGVSVYTSTLLSYFVKQANEKRQFLVYLRDEPKAHLPKATEFFEYRVIKSKLLWSQIFLPLELYRNKEIDVFFSPAHYSPRFCPVPVVVTIHDLSYFYYPNEFLKKDLYKLTNWTKQSIEKAKKVITVSKTTKKDVLKFYKIPDSRIEVIYNGFEKPSNQSVESKSEYDQLKLEKFKYVLYVGTLQPRKNIQTLIKAFKKFHTQEPDYKLVITGRKGWLYEEIFQTVEDLKLQQRVIFTGYAADATIGDLYKNAFCFVLPSLYEGFGIPILEAMSYNCPVITSHSSSLPEIGADACLYFNATDENDLLGDLNLLTNIRIRKEQIEKGKERITHFSWEKCAEETLEVIEKI